MSVAYSTIKTFSEPESVQQFLAEQIIGPLLPSVQVVNIRPIQGRRFEAPRVLWNVYEAELPMPDGTTVRRVIWTKAFFDQAEAVARDYSVLCEPGTPRMLVR